jgi:hypothetical protein
LLFVSHHANAGEVERAQHSRGGSVSRVGSRPGASSEAPIR